MEEAKSHLIWRLADAPRGMDSEPVIIRVGNVDTASNSEVTGVALNITTNKKDEN